MPVLRLPHTTRVGELGLPVRVGSEASELLNQLVGEVSGHWPTFHYTTNHTLKLTVDSTQPKIAFRIHHPSFAANFGGIKRALSVFLISLILLTVSVRMQVASPPFFR